MTALDQEYFCYKTGCKITNKLKLVMKADELELWIALLTTWNFITVQRNR
jgi:hypothetical protein